MFSRADHLTVQGGGGGMVISDKNKAKKNKAYKAGKKCYTVVCREKNAITRGLGEKKFAKPNHPSPPPLPLKMSNGRPFSLE